MGLLIECLTQVPTLCTTLLQACHSTTEATANLRLLKARSLSKVSKSRKLSADVDLLTDYHALTFHGSILASSLHVMTQHTCATIFSVSRIDSPTRPIESRAQVTWKERHERRSQHSCTSCRSYLQARRRQTSRRKAERRFFLRQPPPLELSQRTGSPLRHSQHPFSCTHSVPAAVHSQIARLVS